MAKNLTKATIQQSGYEERWETTEEHPRGEINSPSEKGRNRRSLCLAKVAVGALLKKIITITRNDDDRSKKKANRS